MATFIVHGPMACGKTRNRETIARLLARNPSRWVEIDESNAKAREGYVHLTNDLPRARQKLKDAGVGSFKVIEFKDLPISATPHAA
jgi:hypothetical protein